jgi:hypothetical protein
MPRTAGAKPPSRARGRSVGGRAGRHRPAGAFGADQAEIIESCGRPENGPARWRGGRVRPARRKQDGEHGWRDLDGGRPARAFRMTQGVTITDPHVREKARNAVTSRAASAV